MIDWMKRMVAGKEMRALDRYRAACGLAWRWNGQIHGSSETADWIQQVGESQRGYDIEQFRESLRDGASGR